MPSRGFQGLERGLRRFAKRLLQVDQELLVGEDKALVRKLDRSVDVQSRRGEVALPEDSGDHPAVTPFDANTQLWSVSEAMNKLPEDQRLAIRLGRQPASLVVVLANLLADVARNPSFAPEWDAT